MNMKHKPMTFQRHGPNSSPPDLRITNQLALINAILGHAFFKKLYFKKYLENKMWTRFILENKIEYIPYKFFLLDIFSKYIRYLNNAIMHLHIIHDILDNTNHIIW